jgi:hypothetical protein
VPEPPPAPVPAPKPPPGAASDLRDRFIHALHEQKRDMAIDNLEESSLAESNGEVVITAAPDVVKRLQFQQPDLDAAAKAVLGRAVRFRFVAGEAAAPATSARRRNSGEDEAMERALADPAVQSFRSAFPDAEVRQVRNLKE